MKKNLGIIDRILRMMTAITLMDMAIAGFFAQPWTSLAWILAAWLLLTGALSFCPLYALFHIHTDRRNNHAGR